MTPDFYHQEVPAELFDGYAVYREIEKVTGKTMRPEDISNVLDAVVRLIRERVERDRPKSIINTEDNTQ